MYKGDRNEKSNYWVNIARYGTPSSIRHGAGGATTITTTDGTSTT